MTTTPTTQQTTRRRRRIIASVLLGLAAMGAFNLTVGPGQTIGGLILGALVGGGVYLLTGLRD